RARSIDHTLRPRTCAARVSERCDVHKSSCRDIRERVSYLCGATALLVPAYDSERKAGAPVDYKVQLPAARRLVQRSVCVAQIALPLAERQVNYHVRRQKMPDIKRRTPSLADIRAEWILRAALCAAPFAYALKDARGSVYVPGERVRDLPLNVMR